MADLVALRELHAWMTSTAPPVLYARCGDLELRLSPPLPVSVPMVESPLDSRDEYRRSIDALLYSSGADPTPFYGVDG